VSINAQEPRKAIFLFSSFQFLSFSVSQLLSFSASHLLFISASQLLSFSASQFLSFSVSSSSLHFSFSASSSSLHFSFSASQLLRISSFPPPLPMKDSTTMDPAICSGCPVVIGARITEIAIDADQSCEKFPAVIRPMASDYNSQGCSNGSSSSKHP